MGENNLTCETCGMQSSYLDEVCYYDVNGFAVSEDEDIERYSQNPDSLCHVLCNECAENRFNN